MTVPLIRVDNNPSHENNQLKNAAYVSQEIEKCVGHQSMIYHICVQLEATTVQDGWVLDENLPWQCFVDAIEVLRPAAFIPESVLLIWVQLLIELDVQNDLRHCFTLRNHIWWNQGLRLAATFAGSDDPVVHHEYVIFAHGFAAWGAAAFWEGEVDGEVWIELLTLVFIKAQNGRSLPFLVKLRSQINSWALPGCNAFEYFPSGIDVPVFSLNISIIYFQTWFLMNMIKAHEFPIFESWHF